MDSPYSTYNFEHDDEVVVVIVKILNRIYDWEYSLANDMQLMINSPNVTAFIL